MDDEILRNVGLIYGIGILLIVLVIVLAKQPISRPTYVKRVFLMIGLNIAAFVASIPTMGEGDPTVFLALSMVLTVIFSLWMAQRYIDLGWSRWWFLTIILPVAPAILIFLPFCYASRLSVVENILDSPEQSETG